MTPELFFYDIGIAKGARRSDVGFLQPGAGQVFEIEGFQLFVVFHGRLF